MKYDYLQIINCLLIYYRLLNGQNQAYESLFTRIDYLIFIKSLTGSNSYLLLAFYINLIYQSKVMNNSQSYNETSSISGNQGQDKTSPIKMKRSKRVKVLKNDVSDEKAEEWSENKKSSSYYWTNTENGRYLKFLQEYGFLLQLSPEQRKSRKVNLVMSRKIKTRNSTQCHTHHQKMVSKHKTIEGILEFYNKQRCDNLKESEKPKINKQIQQIVVEEKLQMKTASQILAIGSIVVLKDYTLVDNQQYQYSEFHERGYCDPFAQIDLF